MPVRDHLVPAIGPEAVAGEHPIAAPRRVVDHAGGDVGPPLVDRVEHVGPRWSCGVRLCAVQTTGMPCAASHATSRSCDLGIVEAEPLGPVQVQELDGAEVDRAVGLHADRRRDLEDPVVDRGVQQAVVPVAVRGARDAELRRDAGGESDGAHRVDIDLVDRCESRVRRGPLVEAVDDDARRRVRCTGVELDVERRAGGLGYDERDALRHGRRRSDRAPPRGFVGRPCTWWCTLPATGSGRAPSRPRPVTASASQCAVTESVPASSRDRELTGGGSPAPAHDERRPHDQIVVDRCLEGPGVVGDGQVVAPGDADEGHDGAPARVRRAPRPPRPARPRSAPADRCGGTCRRARRRRRAVPAAGSRRPRRACRGRRA